MFGLMRTSVHDRWVRNHLESCGKCYAELHVALACARIRLAELEAQIAADKEKTCPS